MDKHDILTKEQWTEKMEKTVIQRSDVNKLIMNYLITEGFKEAAEKFQQESGMDAGDMSSLSARLKIRQSVQNGDIEQATSLVNQLYPELLDTDHYLFFHLQQQRLIELIRSGNIDGALKFAQDHLAERGEQHPQTLDELERTIALLAFEEPEKSPFGDLLNVSHRQKVASELNSAILKMEDEEQTNVKLAILLKQILWAQDELERKKLKFPKMTDLANACIEKP